RYDGVYRKHQGGGQTCQYKGHLLKTLPILGTARPTEAQQAVYFLLERLYGPVPDHRKIRQQPGPPEHHGYRKVGGDRKYVPKQWGVEVHPKGSKLVGYGKYPIGQPGAAHVDDREKSRLDHRKNGHGLRRTVDRHSPLLPEEQEYGRYPGTCVADTHPADKVGDVPGPVDGPVKTPDPDSGGYGINDTSQTPKEGNQGNGEDDPPLFVGLSLNRTCYVHGYIVVALFSEH